MSPPRIRVGVIGCGLIAQVMHLPHLRELNGLFEIAALCDLSRGTLDRVGDVFGVERRTTVWEEMLDEPLDAVMVLTPGSHAPAAIAAADAGLHVFVEKPMALSVAEGQEMVIAAERAGVRLMVGYMKRFDPAYRRLEEVLPGLGPLHLVRATTLEAPLEGYVAHLPLVRSDDVPAVVIEDLVEDDRRRTDAAIGADAEPLLRRAYREMLLDSMIHELNALRGVLGEPDQLSFASIRPEGVDVVMRFGNTECVALWVDLPGLARYEQEWGFFAAKARATLRFPSPFLRNEPTMLILDEEGVAPAGSRRIEELVAYDEAFLLELIEFHSSIVDERSPRTDGADGSRDLALCRSIVDAFRSSGTVEHPAAIR